MPSVDFLTEIRNQLPASDALTIISRLRIDPLVWASLQEGLVERVLAAGGENPQNWSPASLMQLAAGQAWAEPARWVLKPAEMKRANQMFDEAVRDHRTALNLKEAGYLAVALLERWQKSDNLVGLIENNAGEPAGRLLAIWRTPLAVLYGMLADPGQLLRALLPKKVGILSIGWITHIVLTNPIDAGQRVQLLSQLVGSVSPAQQINWLRYLQLGGYAELASQVARGLLAKTPAVTTGSLTNHTPEKFDLELNVVRLVELIRMVGLYRYSDQTANARAMAQKAKQTLSHLDARLNLLAADLDLVESQADDAVSHLKKVVECAPSNSFIPGEAVMALVGQEGIRSFINGLPEEIASPIVSIYRARGLYEQGNLALAREQAVEAAHQLLDQLSAQPVGVLTHYLGDWQPVELVRTLLGMNLANEALACAEKLLETRPLDLALLEQAAKIAFNQHQLVKSLEFTMTLQLLQPENADRHRQTARVLEKMGKWLQAKVERAQVIAMSDGLTDDWIALGRCFVHLAEWDEVLEASGWVLEREPENGKACALKGQALMALGKQDEAVKLLNQATLLAPEEAEPWLALAKMQAETGDEQRSMDTMKAAVLAVPDSAEVNFGLGKAFIRGGLFSDGLPFLRKAAVLAPESVEVTLDLGRTLVVLGHHEEARRVLEQGRQRWPSHAALAHAFAETALLFNEREAALEALDTALQGGDVPLAWIMLAAQTLTRYEADGTRPEPELGRLVTAQMGLEKGIVDNPDCFEARLLRAEILIARHEYPQAYDSLQNLVESGAIQKGLNWRLQAGLGESALRLEKMENALVALKEAIQERPDDPRLQRLLAETYHLGRLEPEAKSAAHDALKLSPDGLEMLEWYAEFAAKLGEADEAIRALRTATQLSPEGAGYWISLAEMQLRQDDQPGAATALETALNLNGLTLEYLRRIARAYLALEQPAAALDCLRRAVKNDCAPDAELWVELAYLYQYNRMFERGHEALQRTNGELPGFTWLVVFQAELLMQASKLDAARACLEHAQRSNDARQGRPATQLLKSMLIPAEWQAAFQTPYAVRVQFAQLERLTGNLAGALKHAEAALELQAGQVELHRLAAELASAMLLDSRAAQLAEMPTLHQSPVVVENGNRVEDTAELLCLLAEIAMASGDLDSAAIYAQKAEDLQDHLPRVLALKTRLLIKSSEWPKAMAIYRELMQKISVAKEEQNFFWLVEAAQEVKDWHTAQATAEKLAELRPMEPQVLLGLVKTIVLSAEHARLCKDVQVTAHAPDADSLGMAMQELFEGTLGALEKLTNPLLVERWRARGRAAFRPSSQNLRILSDLLPADDEAAALMALLRETHNLSGAIQTAQDYPNAAPVLVQLGLCHLTVDPAQGLKAVNRAAEIDATHPFVLAVLAMMLQRNGYLVEALEAWETALEIWEDEPQWQAKAASLASEIGDLVCAIDHWEKATALEPAQLDFLAELSKVYLEDGKSEQAMGLLEQATAADDSRADLWYLLAQANRHANYLQQALACAEKACSLDAAAVQPLLLCGEIALQMGNPDLALEYAHKALASQPANEAAVLFQVKVNEWNGKPEEGLNLLEKSITPDSSVMMVLAYTRLVYKQRGAQAALPMLKKIAETDPDEVGVLNLLAHAQEECGEAAGSEKTAYQALQLNPNQADLNLLMGRLKRRGGQLDQSVHYLSEAVRQDPDSIDAYLELGKTYVDRREMVQALHTYEKAIKADPSDHRPYYQAGIVLRESKDYIGAEAMLRRAAELAPQDVNIRRLLGAVITLNLIHNSQEVGTIHELQ